MRSISVIMSLTTYSLYFWLYCRYGLYFYITPDGIWTSASHATAKAVYPNSNESESAHLDQTLTANWDSAAVGIHKKRPAQDFPRITGSSIRHDDDDELVHDCLCARGRRDVCSGAPARPSGCGLASDHEPDEGQYMAGGVCADCYMVRNPKSLSPLYFWLMVRRDTSGLPANDSQITNLHGKILLGFEENDSLNLDVGASCMVVMSLRLLTRLQNTHLRKDSASEPEVSK